MTISKNTKHIQYFITYEDKYLQSCENNVLGIKWCIHCCLLQRIKELRDGKNSGIEGRPRWTSIYKNNKHTASKILAASSSPYNIIPWPCCKNWKRKKIDLHVLSIYGSHGLPDAMLVRQSLLLAEQQPVPEQGKVPCWQQREQQDSSSVLPAGTAHQYQLYSVRLLFTNKMEVQMVWEYSSFSKKKKGNPKDQRQMGHGPGNESRRWAEATHLGSNQTPNSWNCMAMLCFYQSNKEKKRLSEPSECFASNEMSVATKKDSGNDFGRPVPIWGSRRGFCFFLSCLSFGLWIDTSSSLHVARKPLPHQHEKECPFGL